MKPALVDFHCYLDLFPDPITAVSAAELACIYTLTVTTTPKAWPRNRELTQGTKFIRANDRLKSIYGKSICRKLDTSARSV
ncbi:MAG TPA: hypothetical protein VN753_19060 [Terracidiphilus sp.]|nr:hypothetical protein [Terracidiphilus sp.]